MPEPTTADGKTALDTFNERHGGTDRDVLFVNRLRRRDIGSHLIGVVIEELDKVCHRCFDAEPHCHCENDE